MRPLQPGLRWLALGSLLIFLTASLAAVHHVIGSQALGELAIQAENRLTLFISHLEGTLSRYDHLPRLISGNRRLISALEQSSSGQPQATNSYLKNVAATTGASDVYLMALNGDTVAASNWDRDRSFIGKNFAFRPYFQQALEGRAGHYFALGATSLKRGYYFSYPVMRSSDVLGVIVFKIDLADLEAAWTSEGNHFVVTDEDGIVFLSTEPDWTYKSLGTIGSARLEQIKSSKRYPNTAIEPLDLQRLENSTTGPVRVSLASANGAPRRQYLLLSRSMPIADWDVHLFANTRAARASQILRTMVAAFALLVIVLLVVLYLANRQRRLVLQGATELLENRVEKRTLALRSEIEERKKAEQSLRDTQSELIQAAKMAGLGQMSAGISHELNQPLTAIRNYADNTRRLLDRDQLEDARANLGEIGEITERMATIITQLRGFSRKSGGDKSRVSIVQAIGQALDMFTREIEDQGIEIESEIDAELSVSTDPVLFNQVLVNILGNAIQAMRESPRRAITIVVEVHSESLLLRIADTGPGVDKKVIDNIFDPFFTTKEIGLGLGLGLSISYRIMESLGGRIEVGNNPAGGACFELYLPDDK